MFRQALLLLPACCLLLMAGCRKETAAVVSPAFSYTIIDGGNNVLPVDVSFTNTTTGATSFHWTFEGGTPASSDTYDPGAVRFTTAGEHKVTLEAWSADTRKTITHNVNVNAVVVAFDTAVLINDLPPVTLQLTNRSTGASAYQWTFEGGDPASFSGITPPAVTFAAPGSHNITLRATQNDSTYTLIKTIIVGPALAPAFAITPSFQDEDYEAPLTAALVNTSMGGTTWQWSATGGTLSSTTAMQPQVTFSVPGTYTITLLAGNGKTTQSISKTITVKPNSNLRTHTGVKLGIASAHGTVGAFYSTTLRRVFTAADNLDTAGKWIDIAFFGLNQLFDFNRFVSPDSAAAYALPVIPGAQHTVFINSQELCGCGTLLTAASFDAMTTDALLAGLTIAPGAAGMHAFSSAVAGRIILFSTADGRKGAIKVTQYVQAGSDSYIIADIKVQKNY